MLQLQTDRLREQVEGRCVDRLEIYFELLIPLLIQLLLPVEFSPGLGPGSSLVRARWRECQVEVQQALLLQRLEERKALESQVEAVGLAVSSGLGL